MTQISQTAQDAVFELKGRATVHVDKFHYTAEIIFATPSVPNGHQIPNMQCQDLN
jgi:hypothetical protein